MERTGKTEKIDKIDRINEIDFAQQENRVEVENFPKSVAFIIGNEFCER